MNPYRRFRTPLLLSAAGAALSAAPALAQDADQSATDQAVADEGAEDGIIIVTAQRRAQDLQDVPAAVTALTGAALENRQIADTNDLQNQIPNVVKLFGDDVDGVDGPDLLDEASDTAGIFVHCG